MAGINKAKPGIYGENKVRVNLVLTPSAIEGLDRKAAQLGLSRSELVNQIGLAKDLPELDFDQRLTGEFCAS